MEASALSYIFQLRGTGVHRWPEIGLDEGRCYDPAHGEYPIVQGDETTFHFGSAPESDRGLNLDNVTVRVGSVTHEWTLTKESKTHRQGLSLRPKSASGL